MAKDFLYIMLIISMLIACNDQNHILLDKAEQVIQTDPDSALIILNEIEYPQRLKEKEKAGYWRLRSLAHNKKREAMTSDSLILFSLDYYNNTQNIPLLIQSYLLAGKYYEWIEKPEDRIRMFTEGLKQAETINDTTSMARFLYELSQSYIYKKEFEKAVLYSKQRIALLNDHISYYLVALFGKGDSLDYYIENGVELALQNGDTLSAAHYLRNYASILHNNNTPDKEDYVKAIQAIRRSGELSDFYKDFSPSHQIMSSIYIDLNQLDSAQYYLDKAKNEKRKNSYGGYSDLNILGTENAIATLQAIIDTKQSKRPNLQSSGIFNDSIISTIVQRNAVLHEQIRERYRLEQQNLKLVIHKQRIRSILILILFLITIAGGLLYLFMMRRKRKYEEIEERTEILQRLLREAQEVKDEKENNSYFFRKTLLQQLGIIRLIATSPVRQNQDLLHKIVDISSETVSTQSLLKWEDLYPIIDSVYDNFYTRLRIKYGMILNEKELQLCCLLCADFSTGEISTIMQQSQQTIYQRKSTIRKKTGMEEKEDILYYFKEALKD